MSEQNQWYNPDTGEYGYGNPPPLNRVSNQRVEPAPLELSWQDIDEQEEAALTKYRTQVIGGETQAAIDSINADAAIREANARAAAAEAAAKAALDAVKEAASSKAAGAVVAGGSKNVLDTIGDSLKSFYTGGATASEERDYYEAKVNRLEALVNELLVNNPSGGGYRPAQRLVMSHATKEAMVQAAMREALNNGVFDTDELHRGSEVVTQWISTATGLSEKDVQMYLSGILGAGASALTMVLSGGNFPLAAAAYFAGQGLGKMALPVSRDSTGKTKFEGVQAEGWLDGNNQPIASLDVDLPLGLPSDIFGDFRFIVADKLARPTKWFPADEITALNYWSNEPYRYVCLDRVTSKVYHANTVRASRIYV